MPRHSTLRRRSIVLSLALCCIGNVGAADIGAPSSADELHIAPRCGIAAGLGYCRYGGRAPEIVLLTGLGNTMKSWPPSLLRDLNAIGGLYAQFFARNYPRKIAGVVLLDPSTPFEPVDDPAFHTRGKLPPHSTQDFENRGIDASVLATRSSPPLPGIPLIVICATDHASPPAFEEAWRRIQTETARQSPLGRLVVADGSGHDIEIDRPAIVVEQVRELVRELRRGR